MSQHTSSFESAPEARLPETVAGRLVRPFARFLRIQSASGVLLLICTIVAVAAANSAYAQVIHDFWHIYIRLGLGSWEINESLLHLINDGLMTIFFFVVGLEIKRELLDGELREPKQAALPIMAAVGGMLVPASVYLLAQPGPEARSGWGIPMATDIAFVVGFLALLGGRVPLGLKIFLLALAIVDDIGAVLVIALFYSSNISLAALGTGATVLAMIVVFNFIGVRSLGIYWFLGVGVWIAFFNSGIHPTIAGVVLGLMTPGRAWLGRRDLLDTIRAVVNRLDVPEKGPQGNEESRLVGELSKTARETLSPLERLEAMLHPWVAFAIMPIFALANAGVPIELDVVGHPVSIAVAGGLVIGKPVGIVLFSAIAVHLGWGTLPAGVTWKVIIGAGCLGGIGFTMSLFIASLALGTELLDAGKLGTLFGSTISALLGLTLLVVFLPSRKVHQPMREGMQASRPRNVAR
jgi:NhaA family Na+:H+ antiporter